MGEPSWPFPQDAGTLVVLRTGHIGDQLTTDMVQLRLLCEQRLGSSYKDFVGLLRPWGTGSSLGVPWHYRTATLSYPLGSGKLKPATCYTQAGGASSSKRLLVWLTRLIFKTALGGLGGLPKSGRLISRV